MKNKIRIIHYSNDNGSKEGVFFTDDMGMDAIEACPPDCTVVSDTDFNFELPSSFPLEYNLEKR